MKAAELIKKGRFLDQKPSRAYILGDYNDHFIFNPNSGRAGNTTLKPGAYIVRTRQLVGPDLNMYFVLFGSKVKREFRTTHDYIVEGDSYRDAYGGIYAKFMKDFAGSVEEYLLLESPPVDQMSDVINEQQLININNLYTDYGYGPIIHEILRNGNSKGHLEELSLLPEAVYIGEKIVKSTHKPKALIGAYKDYKQFLV